MADDFTPLDKASPPGADDFTPLATTPGMEMVKEPPKSERPQKSFMRSIGEGVLPTVGAVGGGMAGGLVSSPSVFGVPLGVLAGETAGAGLGEKANQWLGITEPSKGAVAASALSAPIGRGIFPLAKSAGGWLVKTVAGRDIMSAAAGRLLQKMMAPTTKAADLFAQARELNFFIPAIKTPQAIDEVVTTELFKRAPTAIRQQILDAVGPLKKYFVPSRGEINAFHANDLLVEEQRLREIAGKAFDAGENQFANAINEIRGAMLDDMERSGAGVVKEASRAYRKEMALDEVEKLFGKPHPSIKISTFMKDNPLTRKAFTQPELAQIDRIAAKLGEVTPTGGTGVFGEAIRGAVGYGAGGMPGVIIALGGPGALRKLLGTQFGRNYTERILGSSPKLSSEAVAALAVFARGMTGRPPKEAEAAAPAATAGAAEY